MKLIVLITLLATIGLSAIVSLGPIGLCCPPASVLIQDLYAAPADGAFNRNG
jgi:hypothetical protein